MHRSGVRIPPKEGEGRLHQEKRTFFPSYFLMYQCQDSALVYKKTGRLEGLNCFPSTLESGINVGIRLSIFEKI